MTLFPALAVHTARMVTFEVRMDIEQQLQEVERRRNQGMRLLAADVWPAQFARRLGVSRQSVLRWKGALRGAAVGSVRLEDVAATGVEACNGPLVKPGNAPFQRNTDFRLTPNRRANCA